MKTKNLLKINTKKYLKVNTIKCLFLLFLVVPMLAFAQTSNYDSIETQIETLASATEIRLAAMSADTNYFEELRAMADSFKAQQTNHLIANAKDDDNTDALKYRLFQEAAPKKVYQDEVSFNPNDAKRYPERYNPTVNNEEIYARNSSHSTMYIVLFVLIGVLAFGIILKLFFNEA